MTDVEHLASGLIGKRIVNVIADRYDPEHGIAGDVAVLLEDEIVLRIDLMRVLWDCNDDDRISDRATWLKRFAETK